jgi:hypothetical protein
MKAEIEAGVQARQTAAFNIVLRQLKLWDFWQEVQMTNPSKDAPYHNNVHMFHVARIAYELYCLDRVVANTYQNLEARALVVAALIHDYDHSMGAEIDEKNIERVMMAIHGWRRSAAYLAVNWSDVALLVGATEYPYVPGDYPDTHTYLRDADLMYSFEPHAMNAVLRGLPQEISVKTGTVLSPVHFLPAQRAFLANTQPASKPGAEIWHATRGAAEEMQTSYVIAYSLEN